MDFNNDHNKFLRAKERVEELKKFYSSLIWYVLVITSLAIVNYLTNGFSYAWFLWAALGWGIGLVFHALKAFRWSPMLNKEWEERKIQEFMEREDKDEPIDRWD